MIVAMEHIQTTGCSGGQKGQAIQTILGSQQGLSHGTASMTFRTWARASGRQGLRPASGWVPALNPSAS